MTADDDDRAGVTDNVVVPFRPVPSDQALARLYEAVVQPSTDPIEVVIKVVYLIEEETEADPAAALIKHPAHTEQR
jgi:hypothetical protein